MCLHCCKFQCAYIIVNSDPQPSCKKPRVHQIPALPQLANKHKMVHLVIEMFKRSKIQVLQIPNFKNKQGTQENTARQTHASMTTFSLFPSSFKK